MIGNHPVVSCHTANRGHKEEQNVLPRCMAMEATSNGKVGSGWAPQATCCKEQLVKVHWSKVLQGKEVQTFERRPLKYGRPFTSRLTDIKTPHFRKKTRIAVQPESLADYIHHQGISSALESTWRNDGSDHGVQKEEFGGIRIFQRKTISPLPIDLNFFQRCQIAFHHSMV